eukprot:UN26340
MAFSMIWKIIKHNYFYREQFLDGNLLQKLVSSVQELKDNVLSRTFTRGISYMLTVLCVNLSNKYVESCLEILNLFLQSPDTETQHNSILALDILVNGVNSGNITNTDDIDQSESRDSKIEYLIDQKPCDHFIKLLTSDKWEVQRAAIRLINVLFSYKKEMDIVKMDTIQWNIESYSYSISTSRSIMLRYCIECSC